MKIFLDTEFTGLYQNTSLLSIGLIDENSQTFYAEFMDYNRHDIDQWLRENVLANMLFLKSESASHIWRAGPATTMHGKTGYIRKELENWLAKYDEVEIWSDCLAYDWVLFNQIWGHAFNLPKNIYYIPFDICTLFKLKGIDPDISREEFVGVKNDWKHNALFDATIIKYCYNKLMEI